jgi:hypothetical protein
MREPTRRFVSGFLSGTLVSVGIGLVLVYGLLGWFLHHIFIVGVRATLGLLWFLFPGLLIAAGGVLLGIRSTQHEVPPWGGRQALGTLFVLLPLLLLAAFPFSASCWGHSASTSIGTRQEHQAMLRRFA